MRAVSACSAILPLSAKAKGEETCGSVSGFTSRFWDNAAVAIAMAATVGKASLFRKVIWVYLSLALRW
ncbi:hypothetical protein GCM10011534_26900 [Pseudooceanicola nanhaiensis]|uniref:Uncharacterized protein n=1 Tax=Pseudooceanicola nanhaiensis TaxID=375761 RepID=A0A917SXQ4_9RHOB|nr:hypothetical protein GCM10011534_26900 [Pseudooceanicola nanhaiensis]